MELWVIRQIGATSEFPDAEDISFWAGWMVAVPIANLTTDNLELVSGTTAPIIPVAHS